MRLIRPILGLALVVSLGCNMKGMRSNNSSGLEGDWALSLPFSQTPGSINFSGGKFKETFNMGSGVNAAELLISGDYASDNKSLHLTNEEFQINKSISFEAVALRELIKKEMGTDYAMEWSGNNVLYLTSSAVGAGAQASMVVGLSRNGGQVDQKKVEVSLEATTGTSGSVSFDANNGGSASNDQNNANLGSNSGPQQSGVQQDQTPTPSQGAPANSSGNDQPSQPQASQAQSPSGQPPSVQTPAQNGDQSPPQTPSGGGNGAG